MPARKRDVKTERVGEQRREEDMRRERHENGAKERQEEMKRKRHKNRETVAAYMCASVSLAQRLFSLLKMGRKMIKASRICDET